MSFTVCAYEDPVADMVVADKIAVLAETEASNDTSAELGSSAEDPEVIEPVIENEDASAEGSSVSDAASEDESEIVIEPTEDATIDDAAGEGSSETSEEAIEEATEEATEEADSASTEESADIEKAEDAVAESTEDVIIVNEGNSTEPVNNTKGIHLDFDNITTDNLDGGYLLFAYFNEDNSTVPYENISYVLSPNGDYFVDENTTTPYNRTFKGASLETTGEYDILSFSGVKEDIDFYVVAKYTDENSTDYFAKFPVHVDYYLKQIYGIRFDLSRITVNNTSDIIINITGYYSESYWSVKEDIERLDTNRISWDFRRPTTLYENYTFVDEYMGAKIIDGGLNATVSLKDVQGPIDIIPSVHYQCENGEVYNAYGYITLDLPIAAEELEAFSAQSSYKIQVYDYTTSLPINIRYTNGSRADQLTYYNVTNAVFTNDVLNECFVLNKSGNSFAASPRPSFINNQALVDTLVKEKNIKTNITFVIKKGSYNTTLTTDEFALSFTSNLPTAKNLKLNNTLEFNSFLAGIDSQELYFADMMYSAEYHYAGGITLVPIDMPEYITYSSSSQSFSTVNSSLPAKVGKKTFKVAVCFANNCRYLRQYFPNDFNITIPVTYSVKNDPTVIKPTRNSMTLNKATNDTDYVFVNYTTKKHYSNVLGYDILDSKGKPISGDAPLNVSIDNYDFGAYVDVAINNHTEYGATYKIRVYPVNSDNGRAGASKDIKVSIVSEKNSNKYSISLKKVGKGIVDASIPYSNLTFSVKGKNINVVDNSYTIKVFSGNDDITSCFYYDKCGQDKFFIREILSRDTSSPYYFNLSRSGYAGKPITLNVTFTTGTGENITETLSSKIGNSVVTPKLGMTKLNVNPDFVSTVSVPLNHSGASIYSYNVTWDFGNNKDTGLNNQLIAFVNEGSGYLSIYYNAHNSSLYGKTCTIAVTPKNNVTEGGESSFVGKAAKFKLTFLDPTKAKNNVSISSKVSGPIDCLGDDIYTNVTFTYKNIDLRNLIIKGADCNSIIRSAGKTFENATHSFYFDFVSSEPTRAYIVLSGYSNVSSGTYKANITFTLGDSYGESREVSTIVTFKVKRSKVGIKLHTSQQSIANRVYDSEMKYKISLKNKKARIRNAPVVELSEADSKIYSAYMNAYSPDECYIVLSVRPGYVFTSTSKGKNIPITKAVTKKVKAYVYYEGSNEPDTVTLTVKITP